MSVEENKVLARRYYDELMSNGDLSFVDKYFLDAFEFSNPTHVDPYRGQEFKNLVTMLRGAFPDVKFTIHHLLGDGDTVVGHWTAAGTHTGTPLKTLKGDIPAQGKSFVIDGMSWLRFQDGKFIEARINEDTLGLLMQIGAFPAQPEAPIAAPKVSSTTENEAMVAKYFGDLMSGGKMQLIDEMFADNFLFHIPTLPEPMKGKEGMHTFVSRLRTGFPDICFTVERQIAEGDKVAARWFIEGTHRGPFLGMPATGNHIKDQGVDIFIFADGKISEIWVNENDLGLMKQLGAFG